MDENKILLTEKEAAAKLECEPQTLNKWRSRRKGPPYLKLSGKIRYRLSDLEQFIDGCRIVPGEQPKRARTRRRRAA